LRKIQERERERRDGNEVRTKETKGHLKERMKGRKERIERGDGIERWSGGNRERTTK
jgi:hypothetical protein